MQEKQPRDMKKLDEEISAYEDILRVLPSQPAIRIPSNISSKMPLEDHSKTKTVF